MKKRLFSLVLALSLCLGLTVPAFAAESDFIIENGILTKYNGSASTVTIPKGVTKIGKSVFYANEKAQKIIIPDGVTEIGENAFSSCFVLHSIDLPSTVTVVRCDAFASSGLRSITIPGSITSFENSVFSQCHLLTSVVISEGVTELSPGMFWGDEALSSVTIPASVTSIGDDAFRLCEKLTIYGAAGSFAESYAKNNHIPFVASLPSVTPGETTPANPDVTSGEQYMIPGLEEYVTFSNPYVGTDKSMAFVGSSSEPEEVTIYEFPVGTKLRLTEKAINSGYRMVDFSNLDEPEIESTELSLTNATTWRNTIWVASNNDPIGVTLYIRPVNPEVAFTDVKTGEYYQDAVHWAVKYGITSGTSTTTFSPGATCSKAQILTFLWRANGLPEPTTANPFTDIKTTDYFYKAALWATEKGLVSGSTFGANTDCTRAMTVEYLWKAAGSPTPSAKASFTDVPANAEYAQAVVWAVENEITSGTGGGNFSPAATCTRGQIVAFLYRAMGQ